MNKTIELVSHTNNSYGVTFTSENFYEELHPELPTHLQQTEHSCHAGDYLESGPDFNLEEFIKWCNSRGIHVLVRSAVYNPKYWIA